MCNQCEVLYINGVKCHETGCPEAYKDTTKECFWCGAKFTPEHKHDRYCSVECYCIDNGIEYTE